ncbi:MAG TPA: methylated-DNA--[protein]-cysteine S-methyltransferase [Acidimicrobiales bacterium]|nr:methylated-DNA--[protein]-cysteine S-methyltransferase [Acidimicrobiales bacterium]
MPQPIRSPRPTPAIVYCHSDTPLGVVLLTSSDGALSGLYFTDRRHSPRLDPSWTHDSAPFAEVRRQLDEYFEGRRTSFDQPLALRGSRFDRAVWTSLQSIPHGMTVSYGQIARRIGQPQAARAVGAANGRNPVSVIVPCHRVIGSDGKLGGYGWGVERKAWLLEHERAMSDGQTRFIAGPAGWSSVTAEHIQAASAPSR